MDTHTFMTPKPKPFVLVHAFYKSVCTLSYHLHAIVCYQGEGKDGAIRATLRSTLSAVASSNQHSLRCTIFIDKNCSVAQSCPTLLQPHGLQHNRLPCPSPTPELTQTCLHLIIDAIQPSPPLLSPSPPTFNLSQHQGLFK